MEWYHYLIGSIALLLLIYLGMSLVFYRKIFVKFNRKKQGLVNHEDEFYQSSYQWFKDIPKEDVHIHSYDNYKLHGYYVPAHDKNSSNIAIVIHGYQSRATDMIIIAKLYSDLGFKVLLIDLRGHGESEGKFTSMGHYEKYDLKKWINFALRSYGANAKILLHGVSMGAAMSMLVTELKIKSNLKFLVLDSGFTQFSKTLKESLRNKSLKVFFPGISLFTYLYHRFTLSGIKPLKAMKKLDIPFLIIQGDNDKVVPLTMANELYDAPKEVKKKLVVIEGAVHAKGFEVDKTKVTNAIIGEISDIFNIKKSYIKNAD